MVVLTLHPSRRHLSSAKSRTLKSAGKWSDNIHSIECGTGQRMSHISKTYSDVCLSTLTDPLKHRFAHSSITASIQTSGKDPVVRVTAWICDGKGTRGHVCAIEMVTASVIAQRAAHGRVDSAHMLFCGDKQNASSTDWPPSITWNVRPHEGVLYLIGTSKQEIEPIGIVGGIPFMREINC